MAPGCNDLIGVHIKRGACAALDGIGNKSIMQLSRQNFVTSLHNCVPSLFGQLANLAVGNGRAFSPLPENG